MSNCAVCHKPVKSGIVVHSECMPRWVSVKDRLPDAGEVIVSAKIFGRNVVGVGQYIAEKAEWRCFKTEICAWVTHWMPLPEPPEVGT